MQYAVTHITKYTYSQAVPVCHNVIHLAPRNLPNQTCENLRVLIHPEPTEFIQREDYFGNRMAYFSIDQAHRVLAVTSTSNVRVNAAPRATADEPVAWEVVAEELRTSRQPHVLKAYEFAFSSRRIHPFPELEEYAKSSFPAGRPILEGVCELTERIHTDFKYDPRATTVNTPLEEVFRDRHGVCQDFAHLEIACLRSVGLAARYVSGYLRTHPPEGKPRLIGADASHAWLSVYCGAAGWIDVDPTNNVAVGEDHITVCWGLDYSDVCPIQGVIVGGGEHRMHVSVDVAPEEEEE